MALYQCHARQIAELETGACDGLDNTIIARFLGIAMDAAEKKIINPQSAN
jgi:hypothetical protein